MGAVRGRAVDRTRDRRPRVRPISRSWWTPATHLPILLALVVAALAGCSGSDSSTEPETLRVAAASDLQGVLPILAEQFERESGVRVVPTTGSSGNLAQQIRQGAPFDVFLSANRRFVEELAADGIILPETVSPYAVGVLVLATNADTGRAVETLDDLNRPEIKRVAIANPDHAPYGVAARQTLQNAGLWEPLAPKLVRGDSVLQAFQFVRTGNAEAGLVALSNALGSEGVRVISIDPELHEVIQQVLGVVAGSTLEVEARSFARFLQGAAAQGILLRNGFQPAVDSPAKSR